MKELKLTLVICLLSAGSYSQVNELTFNHQNFNSSSAPRTGLNAMSLRLIDNYNNGGPSTHGTILEIYGLYAHQTSQLHFGGWDSSRIRYREAFYAQGEWSPWITLLDSKNDVQSAGNLLVSGTGNSSIIGNLGVGTSTPTEKLSVNGKIRAQEIKVDNTHWPDYVFTKGYQLPTLEETEKQIKVLGHLPGIPSTLEVKANGIDLGEMNARLLKKIEELTLHIISLEKRVKSVENLGEKPGSKRNIYHSKHKSSEI